MLALALFVAPGQPLSRAAEARPTPPSTAVAPRQLDHAIDEVLGGPNFQWRLRPKKEKAVEEEGPVASFFRKGFEMVRSVARTVKGWFDAFDRWISRRFSRDQDVSFKPEMDKATSASLVKLALYVFIGIVVILLGWLLWLIWKQSRRSESTVLKAHAVTTAAPDLRDENVQAALLPADGWLALAREQAERGEWRLALRALYLAMLARLAEERLISLAAFKTNLDYERELRRRALSRTEVVGRFVLRRRKFEDVWYGRATPGPEEVKEWMAELERPAAP
jgi:hypothetical protein